MFNKIRFLWRLCYCFGPKWLIFRAFYAWKIRSGFFRKKIPARPWEAQPLKDFLSDPSLAEPDAYLNYRRKHAPPFFFEPSNRSNYLSYFSDWDKEPNNSVFLANEISQGKLRYFEHTTIETGFPPIGIGILLQDREHQLTGTGVRFPILGMAISR